MKKIHIEFDLFAADKTAEGLTDTPEVCLTDNILEALDATDECEYIENFKIHNLTSDADGEEMLTVSANTVRAYKENIDKYLPSAYSDYDKGFWVGQKAVFEDLFGSKCLPDEKDCATCQDKTCKNYDAVNGHCRFIEDCKYEPKPAEPFKVGDKVKVHKIGDVFHGAIGEIIDIDNAGHCYLLFPHAQAWFCNSDLEPYAEPKEVSKMRPIESKVSVYLATKEEDEEFRLLLHKNGFKWETGTSLINTTYYDPKIEATKIYYLYPDKSVTYYGRRTSDTLTLAEFEQKYFGENVNLSQGIANCDKCPKSVKKTHPDFGHSRLHIAAMAMQGILANSHQELVDMKIDKVAELAIEATDALIKEAEKGNSDGED